MWHPPNNCDIRKDPAKIWHSHSSFTPKICKNFWKKCTVNCCIVNLIEYWPFSLLMSEWQDEKMKTILGIRSKTCFWLRVWPKPLLADQGCSFFGASLHSNKCYWHKSFWPTGNKPTLNLRLYSASTLILARLHHHHTQCLYVFWAANKILASPQERPSLKLAFLPNQNHHFFLGGLVRKHFNMFF